MNLFRHPAIITLSVAYCLLSSPGLGSCWSTIGTDSLLARLDDVEFSGVRIDAAGTICLGSRISLKAMIAGEEDIVWQTAADRAGNLLIATGHRSRLYRSNGWDLALLYDGGDGEILSVATDRTGTAYFGTSPAGHLFRVMTGAAPETMATTGENYIFSLLPDPRGGILCATGTNGRLLRISTTGSSQTLYSAPQANLTALAWLDTGKELALGTSPAGIAYRLSFRPGFDAPAVSVLYDTPLEEVRSIVSGPRGRLFIAANPAESGDESGNPTLFCVDSGGILAWDWVCPDSIIFSMAWRNNELWVATGNQGLVYSLDSLGTASVIFKLPEPQVTCLSPMADNRQLLLGTGSPGRVYSVSAQYADSGYIISPPFDCVNPARFGRIETHADIPLGTELTVDLRTGNSATPDSTWSNWSTQPPPGRFVQWRARLSSSFPGITPTLRRVDVYYSSVNRAPEVRNLTVSCPTESEARRGAAKPVREITWSSADSDSDSLVYELYISPAGSSSWRLLGRDLTEERFQLDSRMLPDGWYSVRVVASDRLDRPSPSARQSELVGQPFPIDNTPPQISALTAAGGRVSFTATDAISAITGCRVSMNLRDWTPAEPVDGIFDAPVERFAVQLPEPATSAGGRPNIVAVWVSDALGNVATAQAEYR